MFSLAKPSYSELQSFLCRHQELPFTYAEVEATREDDPPRGYSIGRRRIRLGEGRATYLQAKESLRQWKMFPADFAYLIWPVPIQTGRVVATLFRAPGFWTLNPCRIVYTIDEAANNDKIERYGFAYGTIGDHLAAGEERFLVEFDHADDSAWYEVYCFSKVAHWLSIIAYPYLRLQQHRFRDLSTKAMLRAVNQRNDPALAKTF